MMRAEDVGVHYLMRIGIDARLLDGQFTGDRTYWRGLISGFAAIDQENEYFLYSRDEPDSKYSFDLPANFTRRVVKSKSDRAWSLATLPEAVKLDKMDVVHVQYTVSPLFNIPVITTIHDITFKLFPNLFTFKDRTLLNLTVPFAIRQASAVIAVSQSTRRDILSAYPSTPEKKVVAIPLAASSEYRVIDQAEQENARALLNQKYNLGDSPYVLAVGVLQPRKNLPMLLNAFRTAKFLGDLPHRLVVTGKRGWLTDEIDQAIAGVSGEDIVFTGYVPDDHLPLLYNCADLFCYPSLYEGFGLPPLEAMACGCPVIVSNTSSLPEVVGNAGVLVDPRNPGAWIDSLCSVLSSPERRATMRAASTAQASRFDWRHTASSTLNVYRTCHNRAK